VKLLVILKTGPRASTKKTIDADWVRVGRNASSEIYLADPRIALEQGLIVNRDGLVYLEGEGPAVAKNTTRKAVRSVRLEPGQPLEIGPYRLELSPAPEGYDGAITLELVRPLEAATDLASRTSRRTLASLGVPKRWASWLLVAGVLAAFLAIPAGRVLDLPWKALTPVSSVGDRFWNPGPVMLAHQPIESKCAACHEVAFQHVKDGACLECHSKTGHHVGPEHEPAALFAGARCTSCHREHKGIKTTHRDDDRFCVECHRDIKARSARAGSSNVMDFAKDHPAFRVALVTPSGVVRVRQGDAPMTEQSNLAFPHATHLDPRGVRSPVQGRMKLECKSCHQPDASKRSFEPISMPKHCQECHNLQFEPAVTTREVPHGKPLDAVTVIEEFYANLALKAEPDSFQKAFGVPGEGLLRRVGEPSSGERQAALALATRKSQKVAKELFEVRVCKTCHQVSPAPEWKVAPVRASHRWMPRAEFDHKDPAQAACADCHDVAKSKDAKRVAER
jgi:predicted CXXCH cytochrome family protein